MTTKLDLDELESKGIFLTCALGNAMMVIRAALHDGRNWRRDARAFLESSAGREAEDGWREVLRERDELRQRVKRLAAHYGLDVDWDD